MIKHLLAGVAAFGLMSGIAFAQAYPPALPSPPGTLVIPAPPPPPIPAPARQRPPLLRRPPAGITGK
jgi:hypothetical protein